jgi:hypothetical protein
MNASPPPISFVPSGGTWKLWLCKSPSTPAPGLCNLHISTVHKYGQVRFPARTSDVSSYPTLPYPILSIQYTQRNELEPSVLFCYFCFVVASMHQLGPNTRPGKQVLRIPRAKWEHVRSMEESGRFCTLTSVQSDM